MPSLNHKIHYLGKLCLRGHEYRQTGKSLRYRPNGYCVQCDSQRKKQKKYWRKPKAVEKLCLWGIDYRKKNKKLIRLKAKVYEKNDRKIIGDKYVKHVLHDSKGIDYDDITPEMIELKRELIIFYRLKKELTDGINSRGNQRTSTDGKTA